jgi:predicted acetyltransferase
MPVDIRNYLVGFPDRETALRAVLTVDEAVFGEDFTDEEIASPAFEVVEDDRTFLAWDGDQTVGMSANFSLELSVPGGVIPTAGVTFIGVRPTHRRRGVMSAMLETLHADGLKRHEPVAALWAAEPAIYPRFGYGVATHALRLSIPRSHGSMSQAPDDPRITLRMVDPADDFETTSTVYDIERRYRSGIPAYDQRWHARHVWDPPSRREGTGRLHTVLAETDGHVRGFLRYTVKPDWTSAHADGTFNIQRMMANDPAAYAALWRYAINFDLMSKVGWWNAPSDDPIQLWLDQPRHTSRQREDQLYIRLLDLPSALSARTYSSDLDVVIEVTDRHLPANEGRWRLTGGPAGATVSASTDEADVSLDVRTLGAAYLGGTTIEEHAAATWVSEHTSGSVALMSNAFRTAVAPHCPFVF